MVENFQSIRLYYSNPNYPYPPGGSTRRLMAKVLELQPQNKFLVFF